MRVVIGVRWLPYSYSEIFAKTYLSPFSWLGYIATFFNLCSQPKLCDLHLMPTFRLWPVFYSRFRVNYSLHLHWGEQKRCICRGGQHNREVLINTYRNSVINPNLAIDVCRLIAPIETVICVVFRKKRVSWSGSLSRVTNWTFQDFETVCGSGFAWKGPGK